MKKRAVLITVFFIMIISCNGQTPEATTNWRTGSQGLMVYFETNQPPTKVYNDQEFMTTLRVENLGAFDVGGAFDRIYLAGFDPNMLTGITSQGMKISKITGKTKYDITGGKDWITFKGNVYLPQGIGTYPINLQATTCYRYETLASGNVCISPNPFSATTRQKICTPSSISLGTQGAPIAVSSINVDASPQKTRFEIIITNVGGGTVLKDNADSLRRCSPYDIEGLRFEDIDSVKIIDVKVGDISIQPCKNVQNGYLRLVNGKGTMYCEMATAGATEYVTNIKVEIGYGYQSSITKNIEIINTNS